MDESDKSINLKAEDRFVSTQLLKRAYLDDEQSFNPEAKNYVSLDNGLELGIVSSRVPEMARAISSILSRSLEDARNDLGGHLPPKVICRIQREIISPWGVAHLWGSTGHRFVLSQPASPGMREIIASILVGRSKDTIFFFTGRYNNLRYSTIDKDVDLQQPLDQNDDQKWFDQFAFPALHQFKPNKYHHIANFVVAKEHRRKKLSRFLLNKIVEYYSRDYLELHRGDYTKRPSLLAHSQFLLCGIGLWQIGDPPWLPKMESLNFYLRKGTESFFIEHDWSPLPAIYTKDGEKLSNLAYNKSYGLPDKYQKLEALGEEDLPDRIPRVIELSQNPRAKLQYFQAMLDFVPRMI